MNFFFNLKISNFPRIIFSIFFHMTMMKQKRHLAKERTKKSLSWLWFVEIVPLSLSLFTSRIFAETKKYNFSWVATFSLGMRFLYRIMFWKFVDWFLELMSLLSKCNAENARVNGMWQICFCKSIQFSWSLEQMGSFKSRVLR